MASVGSKHLQYILAVLLVIHYSVLYCEAVFCRDIKNLKYGDMVSTKKPPYEVGTVIKFKCDKGFKSKGKASITCQEDGKWSGPVPYCQAFACKLDKKKIEEGRNCRKPCKSDAECKGGRKWCLCDGWCGKTCYNPDGECPPLKIPKNGYAIADQITYGHTATYGCNEGYILSGPETRTCRSDRKWSGVEPLCIAFSSCGLTGDVEETLFSGKVIAGTDAKLGAWPWQALLFINNQHAVGQIYNRNSGFGGGSVINDKWILTAAHLFEIFPGLFRRKNWPQNFLIALGIGEYPEQGEVIPNHVNIYEPGSLIRHPDFNTVNYDYDVALLSVGKRLKRAGSKFVVDDDAAHGSISFSKYIRPVCLPCMDQDPQGAVDIWKNFNEEVCKRQEYGEFPIRVMGRVNIPSVVVAGDHVVVTGFGKKRITGENYEFIPKKLQEGLLKVMKDSICIDGIKAIQSEVEEARYTDRMLCADSLNDSVNVDACQGDSGGPLVKKFEIAKHHSYWMQVGIVSWGWGCGDEHPGYYTSVTSIMAWVWQIFDDTRVGEWYSWNSWSPCTKKCGTGSQFRTRVCQSRNCEGADKEDRKCNTVGCRDGDQCTAVHAPAFGSITVTPHANSFPTGTVVRFSCSKGRYLKDGPFSVTCLENLIWSDSKRPICEDEWTQWSEWSDCTATCNGVRWKARRCRRVSGLLGLLSCTGDTVIYSKCNTDTCDSDGNNNECQGGSALCVKDNLNVDTTETFNEHLSSLLSILGG